MARLVLGRRRAGVVASVLVAGLVVLCTAALTGAFAGTSNMTQTNSARQQFAQHLLKTKVAQLMTWPAQAALHIQATGDRQLTQAPAGVPPALPRGAAAEPAVPSANLANVLVNNPSEDTHQVDQTTQSETTIAVAGSHVAVGFNDSQQTGLFLTAGSGLSGYSYSADGGASFTDGGNLPNAPEFVNFGDPWMASDRAGTMYYATLAVDFFNFNLYVAYDDFSFDSQTNQAFTGLPVARSTDGGATWQLTYADKFILPTTGCSFQQYIGAMPVVDSVTGTLYVTAEKIA